MLRTALFLMAALVVATSAQTADKPQERQAVLERKLHGAWMGGDCQGTITFAADGTFERQHYSPGDCRLAGTWEVRWDALPPTMILTCTTADDPEFVGREEVKLTQLDGEAIGYQYPGLSTVHRYWRIDKLAVLEQRLHGTWKGGACMGELTFYADGSYERTHYTPGNNTVTGNWEVRWHALPPTLILTCETSNAPDRIKVGQTTEVKIVRLDEEALHYQYPGDEYVVRYEQMKRK
jgi:hypothetical protein